jgi:pimeloyl-ACP methyl ester carboxylesterase
MRKCVSQVLELAPERFVMMGTSFGGRVALETALAAPDRVAGLIIIGAGPGQVADQAAGLRRSARIRGGEFEAVLAEMGNMVSHLPGENGPATRGLFIAMGKAQGSDVMARQSDALAYRTDLWPELPKLACPALMLWGRFDQFSPAADGLRMSMAVPKGRYVEIPDCGHFPTTEAPEETVEAIRHWLLDSGLA